MYPGSEGGQSSWIRCVKLISSDQLYRLSIAHRPPPAARARCLALHNSLDIVLLAVAVS